MQTPVDRRLLSSLEYAPACLIEALARAYPDLPQTPRTQVDNADELHLKLFGEQAP